jgi:protocatechuate 3,4-dioxygenase beta subunit
MLRDKTAPGDGTESSLLGPFYRAGAPELALGDSIAAVANGPPLLVRGVVVDGTGNPVPHARIQVWQTDAEGAYDLQVHGDARADMRGNFRADEAGRFHFRTLRPLGYSIPMDGPVGALIRAQSRHGCRPAHIHFLIGAPGYRELVTALYLADDRYLASDTVFGVSNGLIVTPRGGDGDEPPTVSYEFRLHAEQPGHGGGRVGADPAQIPTAG